MNGTTVVARFPSVFALGPDVIRKWQDLGLEKLDRRGD